MACAALQAWAREQGIDGSFAELCADSCVRRMVLHEMDATGKRGGLKVRGAGADGRPPDRKMRCQGSAPSAATKKAWATSLLLYPTRLLPPASLEKLRLCRFSTVL